ncbi:hypothetical protein [Ornithinimicrobium sp. W1665]|uniref:hypothetical protein n=1 Tax=Ornithinimicrobium sp. W1665 TaxID=3416666 RepID=UPI003CEB5D0B
MADRAAATAPTWWPGLLERVEDRARHGRTGAGAQGRPGADAQGRPGADAQGRPGADAPVLVGVDGRSGAGKTDLAAAAAQLLDRSGHAARVVHLEDLYPGWSGLAAALPRLCEEVVAPLLGGGAGRYRSWDWHADRPGPWVDVPPEPVVVVEGVGVLASPCADGFAVRLWLEAPARVRRVRALTRDGEMFAPHWRHWAEQEDRVLGTRPPADGVVDTVTGRTRWSTQSPVVGPGAHGGGRPGGGRPGGGRPGGGRPGGGRPGTDVSGSTTPCDRLGP